MRFLVDECTGAASIVGQFIVVTDQKIRFARQN